MPNTWILYKTEIRKITTKKSVWAASVIGFLFILLVAMTNLSADGHKAYVKQQAEILTGLTGKVMDDAFFEDFRGRVDQEIESHPEIYERINTYDPWAVYENASDAIGEKALYDFIYNVVRDREAVTQVNAESFYEAMREDIIKDSHDQHVPEDELSFWLKRYDGIEKPIHYSYALAYLNIIDVLFIIGWVLILCVSIAMSGVYADEKIHRTDAMILSSRNGRRPICIAKIAAGITVAILQTMMMICICCGIMCLIYGTTGWNAMIQNVIPSSPWPITIGKMMLIYFVLAILMAIFFAMTNMVLSQLTKSSVATLAIHAAFIFAGLFNIPGELGFIAKLWQLRPTLSLYYGTFCNTYMYGKCNNVQAVIILYIAATALLITILMLSYKKAQVESR